MNKDIKDDLAALDYATKHNCSVAAARLRMAHEAKKSAPTANGSQLDGGTTDLPVETLQELKKPETGKK
jgi:hypothetical protein